MLAQSRATLLGLMREGVRKTEGAREKKRNMGPGGGGQGLGEHETLSLVNERRMERYISMLACM